MVNEITIAYCIKNYASDEKMANVKDLRDFFVFGEKILSDDFHIYNGNGSQ